MALALLLGALAATLMLARHELREMARRLELAMGDEAPRAMTDGLTGLHNRDFFEEALRLEVARTLRAGTSMGLLAIELDHSGELEGTHGSEAGSLLLADMAECLRRSVRACDVVARYTGGELMVLLPRAGPETLMDVGERCCAALGERPFTPTGLRLRVTVSVGGALLPGHAGDGMELIRVAGRALLGARAAGGQPGGARAGVGGGDTRAPPRVGRRPCPDGVPGRIARGGNLGNRPRAADGRARRHGRPASGAGA